MNEIELTTKNAPKPQKTPSTLTLKPQKPKKPKQKISQSKKIQKKNFSSSKDYKNFLRKVTKQQIFIKKRLKSKEKNFSIFCE